MKLTKQGKSLLFILYACLLIVVVLLNNAYLSTFVASVTIVYTLVWIYDEYVLMRLIAPDDQRRVRFEHNAIAKPTSMIVKRIRKNLANTSMIVIHHCTTKLAHDLLLMLYEERTHVNLLLLELEVHEADLPTCTRLAKLLIETECIRVAHVSLFKINDVLTVERLRHMFEAVPQERLYFVYCEPTRNKHALCTNAGGLADTGDCAANDDDDDSE